MKLDTLISNYKIDSKYHAFGSYTNTDSIQSLTADQNGTATGFMYDNTGRMSNDYIEQSAHRNEYNEQTGLNLNYQFNDGMNLALGYVGVQGLEQGVGQ